MKRETIKKYVSVEALAATMLFYWGAMVANPGISSFAINSRIFQPMEAVAPEIYWGALYALCGALSWFLIVTNRREWAELANFLGLSSIAVLFFLGDPAAYAWGIYFIAALFNLIAWRASKWNLRRF